MSAKMSGRRDGRIELSQRGWTLPDGTAAGLWSLAPGRDPGGDRHAREAARQIPTEHRETAWLQTEDGRTWWALLDTRTDRAAYASTRDEIPEDVEPVDVVTEQPAEPEPVEDVEPEPTPIREEPTVTTIEQTIVSTLRGFDVHAEVAEVQRGAAVDRYALTLAPGTKVAQVTKLADDVALAIGARGVRIASIPGTKHVGIEIPAQERVTVTLAEIASDLPTDHPLRIPVGLAVDGSGISARIDRLPHLLIAGTTGSGKSVWLTSILAHLATTASPAQVQMMLIDPKRVELAAFSGIRHLAAPVASNTTAAIELLDAAVAEMESRYDLMERAGVRNIAELGANIPPHLVVAVEELADLMLTAGKRAEASLVRLLQVGRAAGVHMLLATQRPSADVVTGLIRANVPSRLVMSVQSHHDSKIALGQTGAEALLGQGDALWYPSGASAPERVQGPYLSTEDLDDMLAPLRVEIDGTTAECADTMERKGDDHSHTCQRDDGHPGAHGCPCGFMWPGAARPVAPVIEAVPTTAPTAETAPEPPAHQPAEPGHTWAEVERAFQWGREYEQTAAAQGMTTRALRPADWWAAAGWAALALLLSVFLFPALPLAITGWAVWTTLQRRRRDLRPVPYRKRKAALSSSQERMYS